MIKLVFLQSVLDKVLNKLEDEKINYEIISKSSNSIIKKFGNFNNYHKILEKGLEYSNIKIRVDRIYYFINSINEKDKLERVIKVLEDELSK